MRTLFVECSMGAAGDMLTAALLDLFDNPEAIVQELNQLGIPDITYTLEERTQGGIIGKGMTVAIHGVVEEDELHEHHHHHDDEEHHHHEDGHTHHHHHSSMADIEHIIHDHISVSNTVKKHVLDVYQIIAQAESKAHGCDASEVHFHEVGMMDAIADITAVCYLMDKLNLEQILVSPIHVGRGFVKCAHGILPVPAPAVASILQGVPTYSKEMVEGELCTPTGAALLKHFGQQFCFMPEMKVEKVGYGMGRRKFAIASYVRAFLGETTKDEEFVVELSFNVDDMTGEEIANATAILLESGANEVYTTAINMKKNRPGILVTVICSEEIKEKLVYLIFKHTTTLGLRESKMSRYVMKREVVTEEVDGNLVHIKKAEGYGTKKEKIEYEDLAAIAKEKESNIYSVRNDILKKKKSC